MTADATSSKNEANELRGLLLDVIIDTRLKPCVEAQEKAEKTAWDLMQDADLNATQTQRKNNTDNLDSQQGCIDREGYRSCF